MTFAGSSLRAHFGANMFRRGVLSWGGRRRCLLQQSTNEAKAKRCSRPNEADAPGKGWVWDGQLCERQPFWPWWYPIVHERHAQSSIDQNRNGLDAVKLEPFAWPDAGFAEIAIDKSSRPQIAIESNE